MRKGEFEVLGKKLLDVGALDIIGLLELDDLKDLQIMLKDVCGEGSSATNVDGPKAGTMSGSHILV